MTANTWAGMTVNERLYSSGKFDAFDEAVRAKDSDKVRAILEEVGLTEAAIKPILDQLEL